MSADGAAGPRGILISYRRDDVADAARSVRDRLTAHFDEFAVRHELLDADIANLITRLDQVSVGQGNAQDQEADVSADTPDGNPPAASESRRATGVPGPTDDHYLEVIEEMTDGIVVPWLGASVRGALPDSRFLARRMAEEFKDLKLASGGGDQDIRLWDAEWSQYAPDIPFQQTCPRVTPG